MYPLEQWREFAWRMSGQQHQYARASTLRGEPIAYDFPDRIRIRRQYSEWRALAAVEHGDGRLVGIEQGETPVLRIEWICVASTEDRASHLSPETPRAR